METSMKSLKPAFQIYKEGTTNGWITIMHDGWDAKTMEAKKVKYDALGYDVMSIFDEEGYTDLLSDQKDESFFSLTHPEL